MPRNKSMTNDGFIRFRSKEGDILPDSSDKEYVLYKAPSGMPRNVTIESAIFNLVSTIVGGGVLSLPFAIDKSGVIVGPLVLILCAVASGFSVYILISGSRRSGANSYEDVMEKAVGPAAQLVTVFLLFTLTYLAIVAYLCLIADLIVPVVEHIGKIDIEEQGRKVVMSACCAGLLPLCFLKSLHALRFSSMLSILSISVLAAMLTYHCIKIYLVKPPMVFNNATLVPTYAAVPDIKSTIRYGPDSIGDLLYTVPVYFVSYLCHFNVLPMHGELVQPTRKRAKHVIYWTMGLCSVLYLIAGFTGHVSNPHRPKTRHSVPIDSTLSFHRDVDRAAGRCAPR